MSGFKDTTKMISGHHFARGGHSIQPHFQSHGAPQLTPRAPQHDFQGNSSVERQVPATQLEAEHGGRGPLTPGYKEGGGTHKHFHVHHHHHAGGKTKSKSKHYAGGGRAHEKQMEMQAEKEFTNDREGGFGGTHTGGTQDKLAKGGKMHINPAHKGKFTKKMTGSKKGHLTGKDVQRGLHSKSGETRKEANFARMARRHFKPLAEGGHIHDDTHEIAPDYHKGGMACATGGTINKVATGGTINKMGAGGALYARGGKVHSGEMKEHLNSPAPRGHKGMREFVKRGGR